MKKLTAALLAAMFSWTLAVYDRNGDLVTARGGYKSKADCDADGARLTPSGGRWICGETKIYRPKRASLL